MYALSAALCSLMMSWPGGMTDCSPNSTDAQSSNQYTRRGASGGSGSNRFDESKDGEYGKCVPINYWCRRLLLLLLLAKFWFESILSVCCVSLCGTEASPGPGLWQSMGGGEGWVPPAGTDYESELLNDDTPPGSGRDRGGRSTRGGREEAHGEYRKPPVGVRRPDLFAPSDLHDSEDHEGYSEDGGMARFNSTDACDSGHPSRPDSRMSDSSGGGADMFRGDSRDQVDHSSMFQPDSSCDRRDSEQNIMFTNTESSAPSLAQWGSEDDID